MKKEVITKEQVTQHSEIVTRGVTMAEELDAIIKQKDAHAGMILLVAEETDRKVAASLAIGGCECMQKALLLNLYEENTLAKSIMREIVMKEIASGIIKSMFNEKKGTDEDGKQDADTTATN